MARGEGAQNLLNIFASDNNDDDNRQLILDHKSSSMFTKESLLPSSELSTLDRIVVVPEEEVQALSA